MAYVTQSILTFMAWLVLGPLHCIYKFNLDGFRERLRQSRKLAAVLAALVEFQKAQCFFLLTIDTATLMATGTASAVAARSWQQLSDDIKFMRLVPQLGAITTTSVNYSLHAHRKLSWYIFNLSQITLLLSTITWIRIQRWRPSTLTPDYVTSCGTSPATYCLDPDYTNYLSPTGSEWSLSGGSSILLFCYFASIGLLYTWAQFKITRNDVQTRTTLYDWTRRSLGPRVSNRTPHLTLARNLIELATTWLVQIILAIWMGILLVTNFRFGTTTTSSASESAWGFGQIIAVTVWVPVVIDGLYSFTCKSTPHCAPNEWETFHCLLPRVA